MVPDPYYDASGDFLCCNDFTIPNCRSSDAKVILVACISDDPAL